MRQNPRLMLRVSLLVLIIALLLPSVSFAQEAELPLELTILYMNDPHAHYDPYKMKDVEGLVGGFAKAQSVMTRVKAGCEKTGRHTLILMAGDLLMGSPYSTVFKGALGLTLMNHMKFDAMVLGNHEFDYGKGNVFNNLLRVAAFPILSANIRTVDGKYPFQKLITRKYPQSSTDVVIFGLTTATTPYSTLPDNVKGLVFEYPIKVAREILTKLRDDDFIIALTHLGVERDRRLAAACPKIDVIIGGHSHTRIPEPEKVGDTLVCQAGAYAQYVGRLDLDAKEGRIVRYHGELVSLGPDVTKDERIVSIIKEHKTKMDAELGTVIGKTDVFLNGSRRNVRSGEDTNLGRLVTYLMAKGSNADVGIINGGAIRDSLHEGPISIANVYTVLPFRNSLVKLALSGKDLETLLQRSVRLRDGSGGKLQTYGINYTASDGKVRVRTIRGESFDPNRTYSVATNNFLVSGGDDYSIFKDRGSNTENTHLIIGDLLVDYIKAKKVITRSVLDEVEKQSRETSSP